MKNIGGVFELSGVALRLAPPYGGLIVQNMSAVQNRILSDIVNLSFGPSQRNQNECRHCGRNQNTKIQYVGRRQKTRRIYCIVASGLPSAISELWHPVTFVVDGVSLAETIDPVKDELRGRILFLGCLHVELLRDWAVLGGLDLYQSRAHPTTSKYISVQTSALNATIWPLLT